MMQTLMQDLRYGLRMLAKNPGFSAIAILTLALGIGANTAIFNVIEAVVLRPLPFDQPDRLVWLNGKMPQTDEAGVSPADFLDYRDLNRSFDRMVGISQVVMAGPSSLSADKPEQVTTNVVSSGFLQTLGVPLLPVRTVADPDTLAAALHRTVRVIDKDATLSAIRPLDDIVASSVSQPRFSSLLLSLFAGLAVTLAAIGIYGVMAYSVSQRTNEIGIRMALGAKQGDVLKMVIRQGMELAAAGVLIGIAGSLVFGRFLGSMLYRVKSGDLPTLVLASIVLFGASLLANYIPARRATRVDPLVALRYE